MMFVSFIWLHALVYRSRGRRHRQTSYMRDSTNQTPSGRSLRYTLKDELKNVSKLFLQDQEIGSTATPQACMTSGAGTYHWMAPEVRRVPRTPTDPVGKSPPLRGHR